MKKNVFFLITVIVAVFISGCASSQTVSTTGREGNLNSANETYQSWASPKYRNDRRFDGTWEKVGMQGLRILFYADTYRILGGDHIIAQGVIIFREDNIFYHIGLGSDGSAADYVLTADKMVWSNDVNAFLNGEWRKVNTEPSENSLVGTWRNVTEVNSRRSIQFYQFFNDSTGVAYFCDPENLAITSISEISYDIETHKLFQTIRSGDANMQTVLGPLEREFSVNGNQLTIGTVVLERI